MIPSDVQQLLDDLDAFVEAKIAPLEREHPQFFDHRRELARTNPEDGSPTDAWEALLDEQQRLADEAGFLRYSLPRELGGSDGTNLGMAIVREHLARRGLGLHNELQSERSIVGNLIFPQLVHEFGTDAQRARVEDVITGRLGVAFGLTEPEHGSDATWMETRAERTASGGWRIDGVKRFNSGMHRAAVDVVFARTSGEDGSPHGITAFWVPVDTPGVEVLFHWWTFNLPTDHSEVRFSGVEVPADAILGEEGKGLLVARRFLHENRIRQAASSLGAAQFCIDAAVAYASSRVTFGKRLSERQAIQFPLVELHTEAELVRGLIRSTAARMDAEGGASGVSDLVSMCNYRANRLACDAADRAMQVHGGLGYTRALPFEHLYRHHRRYRITEGSEEIQMRNVAGHLFGFIRR